MTSGATNRSGEPARACRQATTPSMRGPAPSHPEQTGLAVLDVVIRVRRDDLEDRLPAESDLREHGRDRREVDGAEADGIVAVDLPIGVGKVNHLEARAAFAQG